MEAKRVNAEEYMVRYRRMADTELAGNPFMGKSELVYSLIMKDILTGHLAMGETIQQDLIARALNCSRSPIREALLRLTDSGFCTKGSNGAFSVSRVSIAEYIDFSEFRISLEVGMTRLAARNATDEDIAALKDNISRMRSAIRDGAQFRDVLTLDHEFHYIIGKASKNQFFFKTFVDNMEKLYFYQAATLNDSNYHNMMSKHEQILLAIESRDEEAAQKQMKSHLSFYIKNMYRLEYSSSV